MTTQNKELNTLVEDLVESGQGLRKSVDEILAWGAEKGRLDTVEKAVAQVETKIKDLIPNYEKMLAQVRRNTWDTNGRYRGAFASQEQARGFGLLVLGTAGGDARAAEAFKKEYPDIADWHTKAQATNPSSSGGALIPSEFSGRVINLIEDYGVFARNVFNMPMGSNELSFTEEIGAPAVFAVGEGIPEETDVKFANITLTAKDWGCLVFYPRNLEDDMIISIAEYIIRRLAWAFALKIDTVGFNGDGLAANFGIKGVTTKLKEINGVDDGGGIVLGSSSTWGSLTLDDFSSVQGSLPQYAAARAQWYMSRPFFFKVLKKLIIKSGGVTAGEIEGRRRMLFDGDPVNITQVMPKATAVSTISALYGDLSMSSTMGVRRQFSVEQSREYKFAQRQVTLLGTSRVAINNHNLGSDTEAGPLVGLMTKASG